MYLPSVLPPLMVTETSVKSFYSATAKLNGEFGDVDIEIGLKDSRLNVNVWYQ
jgi:hypothetical protein